MARNPVHPFDVFINQAAALIAQRLAAVVGGGRRGPGRPPKAATASRAPGGLSANEKRRRAMLGRKLDMSCRIPGCNNRSGGPGKGYMCPKHQKLPKKQQLAAREAWKAAHPA